MQKIAITGGKGGVGKSTFSILLAQELFQKGKKILLCDCDVECPNDYLLIGVKLKTVIGKSYTTFPKLNKKKCKKCGLCAKICRNNAIFVPPGKYPTFIKDLCSGCGACMAVCPFGAIEPQEEETGKIYLNEVLNLKRQIPGYSQAGENPKFKLSTKVKNNFWLVTGVAKPGLEETGPVVQKTKEIALEFGRKVDIDIVLFDTAPGTHCPVISALLGCDLAYVVTEPTPMGIHDLNVILELLKKLKVKSRIVINQADLGDKKRIKKIAERFNTEIKTEIPYSKDLAKAYSKGQLLDYLIKNKIKILT